MGAEGLQGWRASAGGPMEGEKGGSWGVSAPVLVALTTGTFFKERMAVEERQPMALSVGYSPSDRTCCSPAKACPSNRIQLARRSMPELMWPS